MSELLNTPRSPFLLTNGAAAEREVRELLEWHDANGDIKFGAIGLLTREAGMWGRRHQNEELQFAQYGKGAKVGLCSGVLAAVLSGLLKLIPGPVAGAATCGAVGSLSHRNLGLTDGGLQQLRRKARVCFPG